MPLFTLTDLEARLGRDVVRSALDGDINGVADDSAVSALHDDALAWLRERLEPVYPVIDPDSAPAPVRRLAREVAHAYLALYHPGFVRRDHTELFKRCEADAQKLREGMHTLGDAHVKPANIEAKAITVTGPNGCEVPRTFGQGFGDF